MSLAAYASETNQAFFDNKNAHFKKSDNRKEISSNTSFVELSTLQNEIPISCVTCDFVQFGPEERSGLRVQRVAGFINRNSENISRGLLVSFHVSVIVTFARFKHYT